MDLYDERTCEYWFKKATTENSILSKTLKLSADSSPDVLQNLFNDMLSTGNFPDNMKLANITPAFKEKNSLRKEKLWSCKCVSDLKDFWKK